MEKKRHINIDVCSLSTHQLYVKKQDKNLKRKELFCHRNLHSFFGQKKKEKEKGQKEILHFLPTVPLYVSYVPAVEPEHNDYVQQYANGNRS